MSRRVPSARHRPVAPGEPPDPAPAVAADERLADERRADDPLAERRFEAVSRAAPIGIFHAELDGRLTYVNPRLQRLLALDAGALRGRRWLALVHPDDAESLLAGWTAANAARQEYEHEFRVVLPDGEVRWVHGRSAVVCDAAGRPVCTVGTLDDVTARRAIEDRTRGLLAISAALSRALTAEDVARAVREHAAPVVGATSSLVALLAPDRTSLLPVGDGGLPSDLQPGWERIPLDVPLPLTAALRTGQPVLLRSGEEMLASYPATTPLWRRLGARALATFPLESEGRRFGAITFRFPRPREFREGGGELAFLRAVVQQCGVSLERARLFDETRAARLEADVASRAKSEFLARMSHELRTPLNAIAGHLQLVEMGLHGPVTEAQLSALTRVNRAQRHLLGLINDVLNHTRLESGRVEFVLTPVGLTHVLDDVLPMVEPQFASRGLMFQASLPEMRGAPPVLAWADREKLVQVLLNLLANAIKFTSEGGAVSLTLEAADDAPEEVALVVRDTGIGIPPDRLETIFEPFVQVNASLTREHQGSGLGLAISRDLARGMGGDLTAANAPGGGAAFTLRLRRAVAADGHETDRRSSWTRRMGVERRSGEERRHD